MSIDGGDDVITEPTMTGSIHGLREYIEHRFTISAGGAMLAFLPFVYIVPTLFVMWRVYRGYRKMTSSLAKMTLDNRLFQLLMTYFLTNILFFVSDYFRFNLPSSGLLTSWCARLPPNRLLTLLIVVTYFLNYCVIVLPFLITIVRLTILWAPVHSQKTSNIVQRIFVLPFLVVVPLGCVSFMLPTIGYCRQLGEPFAFGAVFVYYSRAAFGMRNAYFILGLSFTICTFSTVLSIVMAFKLRRGVFQNASKHTRSLSRRAEISISLTMISSIVPMITNTIVSTTTIWAPDVYFHFYFLRTVGNDFETVMMPWLLFLTHPVFREKASAKRRVWNGVSSL